MRITCGNPGTKQGLLAVPGAGKKVPHEQEHHRGDHQLQRRLDALELLLPLAHQAWDA